MMLYLPKTKQFQLGISSNPHSLNTLILIDIKDICEIIWKTSNHIDKLTKFRNSLMPSSANAFKKSSRNIFSKYGVRMINFEPNYEYLEEAFKLNERIKVQEEFQDSIECLFRKPTLSTLQEVTLLFKKNIKNMKRALLRHFEKDQTLAVGENRIQENSTAFNNPSRIENIECDKKANINKIHKPEGIMKNEKESCMHSCENRKRRHGPSTRRTFNKARFMYVFELIYGTVSPK